MTRLFCQVEFRQIAEEQRKLLREEINAFSEDYLSGVPDDQLVEYLFRKYSIETPTVSEPHIESQHETKVDVRHDWRRVVLDKSKPLLVPGHRIEVRLPFIGMPQIFNIAPSTSNFSPPTVSDIGPNYLSIVFEHETIEPERIRQSVAETVGDI